MDVAHRLGEKMVTVITFLDLKDAFSTIGHDFLQQALKYADVPAKLQRLIIQIYKTATGKVRATNAKGEYEYSRSFEIKRGILQGDIMSPVLFVLGFAMIFVLVKNQNSSGTGVKLSEKLTVGNLEYADDAALANVATIEKEKMVAPLKMLGNKTRPQGAAPRAVTELERRDFDERKLWNGDERHPTVSGWVERELPLDQKVVAIKKAVKEASTNLSTVARIAREVGNLKVSIPKTKCLLAGQGLKQKVTEEEIEKRSVNFEFACEDCGRRFPSKRSLKPHARFCLSQKSEEKFAIERVFDVCETNNGRWFHVQWEGGTGHGKRIGVCLERTMKKAQREKWWKNSTTELRILATNRQTGNVQAKGRRARQRRNIMRRRAPADHSNVQTVQHGGQVKQKCGIDTKRSAPRDQGREGWRA